MGYLNSITLAYFPIYGMRQIYIGYFKDIEVLNHLFTAISI